MQFSAVIKAFQYLVFVFLCLALLLIAPVSSSLQCLQASDSGLLSHPIRRHLAENTIDSNPIVAATMAHLSPVVFRGTLLSVLVQRDGTVRAAFGVDQALKVVGGDPTNIGQMEVVYLQNSRTGSECVFEVNEENLRLGKQYIVYGRFLEGTRTSVVATAFPIEYEKQTFKAIKRVVCKGCAKPPRAEGLKNVRIVERRKLRLQCHLSGNPIPWVEWYKNGQLIDGKGRIKVRTRRRTSRLVIRQSRLQDEGVYECRAVNVVQNTPAVEKAIVTVTRKTTKKPKIKTTAAPTVSSLWPTGACPNSAFCLNGGTCIFYRDVREYVCHCAEGFVGLRCDYKDVRAPLGAVKNMESEHNRLFTTVVLLFILLSCLNWGSLIACWICCFRKQEIKREMAPLNTILNFARRAKETQLRASVDLVDHETTHLQSTVGDRNCENEEKELDKDDAAKPFLPSDQETSENHPQEEKKPEQFHDEADMSSLQDHSNIQAAAQPEQERP